MNFTVLHVPLTLLPSVMLPLGTAAILTMATIAPNENAPLLAYFGNDQAAVAGAVAADATLIGFAAPGTIAVGGGPGLVERLRLAGATRITNLRTAVGCQPTPR